MTPILLLTALSLSLVAGYYSIVGLATIFAAAMYPVIIMGSVLEVGKLVTTVFLHNNWNEINRKLKVYLTVAVATLMFITSMGIFGFLSKAHIEQSVKMGGNNAIQIENFERQIANEIRKAEDAKQVISQLDAQVQTLIQYDRIRGPSGSISVRESQSEEREALNQTINQSYDRVEELQKRLTPLKSKSLALEAEIGPLKYIAELIYGDEAKDHFDETVRWVIILIIFVFDPLAVSLLIAWSWSNNRDIEKSERELEEAKERGRINREKYEAEQAAKAAAKAAEPTIVEKIVEVPVEVEKVVEKIVEVPVEKIVEKIVEVPVIKEPDITYVDTNETPAEKAARLRKDENKKYRKEHKK